MDALLTRVPGQVKPLKYGMLTVSVYPLTDVYVKDAYVLAELLGHPSTTRDTIPRALSIYDSIRRPWTQDLAERARINGQCLALHLDNLDFENFSSNIIAHNLHKLGGVLVDNWKWAWETDARQMLHRAIEQLEGKGVS
jgi:salicylate hydroxylase